MARTHRPRSTISLARPSPISRASRCVPPLPGIIPSRSSGWAKTARLVAIRKSQATAMTGPGNRSGAATFSCRLERAAGPTSRKPPISPPAEKACSPAPRIMTTWVRPSSSSVRKIRANWSRIPNKRVLSFSGRLMTTRAIPVAGSSRTSKCSKARPTSEPVSSTATHLLRPGPAPAPGTGRPPAAGAASCLLGCGVSPGRRRTGGGA